MAVAVAARRVSDTIAALSSGAGRAGIAVIRVSGPDADAAIAALTGRPAPPPRRASLRWLRDAAGAALDQALVLWLPGPNSATGEDMAEFHTHGGRAVIDGVLAALCALPGLRLAEPGEFSRRAFDTGRLDLTQVEAMADLIAAETAAQRRQALDQMGGRLTAPIEGWRDALVQALAHLEADLDFPDEDLPEGVAAAILPRLRVLAAEMAAALDDGGCGERLRDGITVALLGPPNAGKSSLLNALARRDAVIVAPTPGTTRDVVEVPLDLGGYPVLLADTAGLRDSRDAVEAEGMRRALARAEAADVRLVLYDAAAGAVPEALRPLLGEGSLLIANKADLLSAGAAPEGLAVSAQTGQGLDRLIAHLTDHVAAAMDGRTAPIITRARHRAAITEAQTALQRALAAAAPELLAEDVRLALRALGRITGRVDVEDLLDVIFADFCIGK